MSPKEIESVLDTISKTRPTHFRPAPDDKWRAINGVEIKGVDTVIWVVIDVFDHAPYRLIELDYYQIQFEKHTVIQLEDLRLPIERLRDELRKQHASFVGEVKDVTKLRQLAERYKATGDCFDALFCKTVNHSYQSKADYFFDQGLPAGLVGLIMSVWGMFDTVNFALSQPKDYDRALLSEYDQGLFNLQWWENLFNGVDFIVKCLDETLNEKTAK